MESKLKKYVDFSLLHLAFESFLVNAFQKKNSMKSFFELLSSHICANEQETITAMN